MKTVSKVPLKEDAMLSLGQTTMAQFASSTGLLKEPLKMTRIELS